MCPRCGSVFSAVHARVYPGIWHDLMRLHLRSMERVIAESAAVRCPGCGHRFSSVAVRFFGVIGPMGLRTMVAVVLLLIMGGLGYLAFLR